MKRTPNGNSPIPGVDESTHRCLASELIAIAFDGPGYWDHPDMPRGSFMASVAIGIVESVYTKAIDARIDSVNGVADELDRLLESTADRIDEEWDTVEDADRANEYYILASQAINAIRTIVDPSPKATDMSRADIRLLAYLLMKDFAEHAIHADLDSCLEATFNRLPVIMLETPDGMTAGKYFARVAGQAMRLFLKRRDNIRDVKDIEDIALAGKDQS